MPELQLPAHLQSRADRGLAAQLALSLPSGTVPYVSIKGSRFTLFDAAGNERQVGAMSPDVGLYLDLCIVDSNPHISKVYYDKPFDPNGEGEAPACFSDNGIGASSQALRPQSLSCKTCRHNEWGSEVSRQTGKPVKACADVQKVAVCVPGFKDNVFLLRIPPVSLKHLGKYIQEVGSISAGGRKVDISDLITRVYFQKDQVGVLGFSPVSFVDPETAATGDKAYESKATDLLVGKNDRPYEGAIGLPPQAAPRQERSLPPPAAEVGFGSPTIAHPTLQQITPLGNLAVDSPAEKKPRGRPRKEAVAEAPATQAPFLATPPQSSQTLQTGTPAAGSSPFGNGGAPSSDEAEDIPAFLKRKPEPPVPSAPQHKPAGPSFGMQSATSAPDDMQARIAAVLGMKT